MNPKAAQTYLKECTARCPGCQIEHRSRRRLTSPAHSSGDRACPEDQAQEKTFVRVAACSAVPRRQSGHRKQSAACPACAVEAARQSLADRHDRGPGCLHGGARHLHRQRGAAPHLRLARRQHRRGHLGADQLPGVQRHRSAAGRMGIERPGPAKLLRLLHRHLHRLELPVRRGSLAAHAAGLPHPAGRGRRRAAAHGAGHHGRLVRAPQARPGLCPLWTGRRARALHRPHARRLDHRQLLLALDLLHQHPGRHSGLHSGYAPGRGSALDQARPLAPAQHGLRRPRLSHHRHGRHADHAR